MTTASDTARARGRLLLVPNVLDQSLLGPTMPGDGEGADVLDSLPLGVLRAAAGLRWWVAETPKVARAFLKRVDAVVPLAQALQDLVITELPRAHKGPPKAGPGRAHEGAAHDIWTTLLAPALKGDDIGLLSDAGLPAVADPGADLVRSAHRLGVVVVPLAGPSSLLLALSASGLNGQSFAFQGYLPVQADERGRRLQELEAHSRRWKQTQLCIETPYRNPALLDALLGGLQPQTQLSVSSGLTSRAGWSHTASVQQWRKQQAALAAGLSTQMPAVFAFLAE
jgi:16S rRNA (cytidine1402-2'-O)-methyltransferase